MTSLPAMMYKTSIFLVGEWHHSDFATGFGQFMCVTYCVFGMGLFGLPIGLVVDSLSMHLQEEAEFHEDDKDDALSESEELSDISADKKSD